MRSHWWFWRTSSTVTVSPVLMVLGVVVSLSNAQFADPYWLDLSSKATVSVLFLAPGFAALAAWDASRWRSVAAGAVRTWTQILAWQLLFAGLATILTFSATLAVLGLEHTPMAGAPRVDVLAVGVWVTLAYTAVGFVVGRLLPRLVAVPLVFIAIWLWVAYTPAIQPFWLRNVTGNLGTSCCTLDTQLVPWALAAPAILTGALLVSAFALMSWSRGPAVWAACGAVVLGALVLSASLVSSAGADPVEARSGTQHCVTHDSTTLCAWPEHADALDQGAPELAAAAARLRDTGLAVPTTLRETQQAPGGWALNLNANDTDTWGRVLATSPLTQLPPACVEANGGYWPAGQAYPLAGAWLETRTGIPAADAAQEQGASTPQLRALLATDDDAQLAWYHRTLDAMRTCEKPR